MRSLSTRLLGVGLAAAVAAVTIALAVTGRIGLYINPDSAWFAVAMSVLALVGTAVSCVVPLGAEEEHDHGVDGDEAGHSHAPSGRAGMAASLSGGILATGIVGAMLLAPPATLSAELAMARDTGTAPLFQGDDVVALAATGDTASFGVGEWASVFATASSASAFDGTPVELTGFVTPGEGGFELNRLVVTHCVIDAQVARVPVVWPDPPETGQWVTVRGTVQDVDGSLRIEAQSVEPVAEPEDPYEF